MLLQVLHARNVARIVMKCARGKSQTKQSSVYKLLLVLMLLICISVVAAGKEGVQVHT